ncbi:MAG: hypothetical protein MI739_02580 [Bacteroidales bacterium]|nr:hypothetical protein [Bacteroidales bacterium]
MKEKTPKRHQSWGKIHLSRSNLHQSWGKIDQNIDVKNISVDVEKVMIDVKMISKDVLLASKDVKKVYYRCFYRGYRPKKDINRCHLSLDRCKKQYV